MLQQLIGPVSGLLDKFIEDKDQKAKLAHEIGTMAEKHGQVTSFNRLGGPYVGTFVCLV